MHSNRKDYSLLQYQAKLRHNYSNLGIVLYSSTKKKSIIFKPIPCCLWLPESRKRYFARLKRKSEFINPSKKYTFCTLTYSLKQYSPEQACKRIKHDIDLFFKRLNYYKSKPEYFYIIELTKKNMPHIHLIFDRYVHKKKIFKSWNKITNSISINIKYLGTQNAFEYCLKYLSKSQNQLLENWSLIFKNIDRLWSSSRNFFSKVPITENNFIFVLCCWNKFNLLDKYFSDFENDYISNDISPPETLELLEESIYTDCVINYCYRKDVIKIQNDIDKDKKI